MDFYFLLGAAISFYVLCQHIIKTPALTARVLIFVRL